MGVNEPKSHFYTGGVEWGYKAQTRVCEGKKELYSFYFKFYNSYMREIVSTN
jgi:hypothetical protein